MATSVTESRLIVSIFEPWRENSWANRPLDYTEIDHDFLVMNLFTFVGLRAISQVVNHGVVSESHLRVACLGTGTVKVGSNSHW